MYLNIFRFLSGLIYLVSIETMKEEIKLIKIGNIEFLARFVPKNTSILI
jgi:hypothetical protein